jgi:PPOX class probable FMN-dependent enzyme
MPVIRTIEQLEAIYEQPLPTSTVKEIDHLTAHYRALIMASPFVALATSGPEGLDCSPRGDPGHVVHIHDERTLMLPDRRGNNRIDSLRNILRDPRVALLFLIPGSGTTMRVNGRAHLTDDGELLAALAMDGKPPRSVIVVEIDAVYFQCARAVIRADLWNPAKHVDAGLLPTPGMILAELSANKIGGEDYDKAWPDRARQSMW